ncbi:MAG: L-2-amino-thiazoline-4-carboxylic acid hydrolase [Candidatus Thorarchaeota archaeon]
MNEETEFRATLWKRLQEVRGCYKDPEQLKLLVEKWEEDFGPEHQDLVDEMIGKASRNYWSDMSLREGKTLDDLVRTLWKTWDEGDFTIEKIPDGVQVYVTKCPMFDAFKSIGKTALGVQFFCNEDEHIVEGFNPHIRFTRTKTLMEGDDCCNHQYELK